MTMTIPFPRLDDTAAPRSSSESGSSDWATKFDELLRPLEIAVREWSEGELSTQTLEM